MMEVVVVTTGAIRHAKFQSDCHRFDSVAQLTVSKYWRDNLPTVVYCKSLLTSLNAKAPVVPHVLHFHPIKPRFGSHCHPMLTSRKVSSQNCYHIP